MNLSKLLKLNSYQWLRENKKILTYGGLLVLFGIYINPIIKEARNRQICALVLTDLNQITNEEAGKQIGLKKYPFIDFHTQAKMPNYPVWDYCKILSAMKR